MRITLGVQQGRPGWYRPSRRRHLASIRISSSSSVVVVFLFRFGGTVEWTGKIAGKHLGYTPVLQNRLRLISARFFVVFQRRCSPHFVRRRLGRRSPIGRRMQRAIQPSNIRVFKPGSIVIQHCILRSSQLGVTATYQFNVSGEIVLSLFLCFHQVRQLAFSSRTPFAISFFWRVMFLHERHTSSSSH